MHYAHTKCKGTKRPPNLDLYSDVALALALALTMCDVQMQIQPTGQQPTANSQQPKRASQQSCK
jgi:hypothetical protein